MAYGHISVSLSRLPPPDLQQYWLACPGPRVRCLPVEHANTVPGGPRVPRASLARAHPASRGPAAGAGRLLAVLER